MNSQLFSCARSKGCLPVYGSVSTEMTIVRDCLTIEIENEIVPVVYLKLLSEQIVISKQCAALFFFPHAFFFIVNTLSLVISPRAFSTSSLGGESRCSTHDYVRTARSSWRKLQNSTSCMYSRLGAAFMRTPLLVKDSLFYIFFPHNRSLLYKSTHFY